MTRTEKVLRIVEILKANEGSLSDGYQFYCGAADGTGIATEAERDAHLICIAQQITDAIQ